MAEMIRETRSVCPVCMKNLPAKLLRDQDGVISLKKECPEHGIFTAPVWRGCLDFDRWAANSSPLKVGQGMSCPGQCGLCPEHESESCCVLLEVTKRCNLHCQFCFASGGEQETEPPLDTLKASIRDIVKKCGRPLLQLSGGEPTLRDDLPKLVRYAREAGCSYVQVNTNGLRLAEDPRYAEALAEAGLDIVFLQFDGTDDRIYQTLRGHPLLEKKLRAIEVCGRLHMGVTLVRVIVLIVIVQIAQVIYMGCLRGAGDVIFTTIASTVSVTIIRTAVSYVMCYVAGLGLMGIWLGILADQISRFLFTNWRFKSGKWTKIRI